MNKLWLALLLFICSSRTYGNECVHVLNNSSKYTEFEVSFFSPVTSSNPYYSLRQLSLTTLRTEEGFFSFQSEIHPWPTVPLLNSVDTFGVASPLYVGQYSEHSFYYEAFSAELNKSFSFRVRRTFDASKKNLISAFVVSKKLAQKSGSFERRGKHEVPLLGGSNIDLVNGVKEMYELSPTDEVSIRPLFEVESKRHSLKLFYTTHDGRSFPIGFFAIGKVLTRSEKNNLVVMGYGGELEIDWYFIQNNPDIANYKELVVDFILSKTQLEITDLSKEDLINQYKQNLKSK